MAHARTIYHGEASSLETPDLIENNFRAGARWAESQMSSILFEAVGLLRDMMYMQVGAEFIIENRVNTMRRVSEFIEKNEPKL